MVILIINGCSPKSGDHILSIKLAPCPDSADPSLLCGTIPVYENPEIRSGKMIDLNVVVIPAIKKDANSEPIFWFDGGPGLAASKGIDFYADPKNQYRKNHDIVLIDIRGTGKSGPLHCKQLQLKVDLDQHLSEMFPAQSVRDCYDSLSQLADLRQYTTMNIAHDIEEVRKFLEYDQINIYGLSYGTRLAQVYMTMYPEAVKSSVLWAPMSMKFKTPAFHAPFAQKTLERLFTDCAQDEICKNSFPNFREEFLTLQERGAEAPFEFIITKEDGEDKQIQIPWFAFHTKIRELMHMPLGLRQIPYIVNQAYLQNFEPFLALYPQESAYNDYISLGLFLSITCTEDMPFIDMSYADLLSEGTFIGNYRVYQQAQACENWSKGVVPDNFSELLESEIPTLILSGSFDPVTPDLEVEEIVKNLKNSYIVTIPYMSHTFEGLSNDTCFDKIVLDFMDRPTRRPKSACIDLMVPVAYRTQ